MSGIIIRWDSDGKVLHEKDARSASEERHEGGERNTRFDEGPRRQHTERTIGPTQGTQYRPKLLVKKAPSMRAIRNYQSVDNFKFLHQQEKESSKRQEEEAEVRKGHSNDTLLLSSGNLSLELSACPDGRRIDDDISYTMHRERSNNNNNKWRSMQSVKSAASGYSTDTVDETGSTVKLISPKFQETCRTCISNVETILCTVAIAAGLGNIYRFPLQVNQTTIGGSLPFLIAYLILTLLIGFPLLFLELGIGQIVQEGFTKTPRAIPFFKGVAYVKLLAGFLLCVTYPLYMGLSLYYLIWFSKGEPPFNECAEVRMENDGYKSEGISGLECLKKTFLMSPFEDPQWFGMYAGLVFVVWILVMAWCIKRTHVYEKALVFFMVCTVAAFIALMVSTFQTFDVFENLRKNLVDNINWESLTIANVWYCALLQVFLSTNIGFGVFTSNAGVIYKKVNPFKTALNYLLVNLLIGIVSVLVFQATPVAIARNTTASKDEILLFARIYDLAVEEKDSNMWAIAAYLLILFAGFISMITITYTMIKGVALEMKNRIRWWQLNTLISFSGFILSCASLLNTDLTILHLVDKYLLGNLVLLSVVLEVIAFVVFYGPSRLIADFEFIMGTTLPRIWIFMWHLCPLLLISISLWSIGTLHLQEERDPLWVFILGWTIVLSALLMVLILGIYNISKQEEYLTVFDKLRASFRQARNWGPSDPMMLHNWKQWHSKAQDGERDFTLKRQGTKEYTHSVKNRSKYQNRTPTVRSNSSTLSGSIEFKKNPDDPCDNGGGCVHVTSLIDAITPVHTLQRGGGGGGYKTNLNPLAYVNNIHVNGYQQEADGGSEGYGTYTHRNGPYIISNVANHEPLHVCHRKALDPRHEQATEL